MSIGNLYIKATYKKSMKSDCAKWRKFLKAKGITIKAVYEIYAAKHPMGITYDGFYAGLVRSCFGYDNYINVCEIFTTLEEVNNNPV